LVSGQEGYLLNQDILSYIDTVAKLLPEVANPNLESNIGDLASELGFNRLSYYWQAPTSTTREDDFAQVILGRQDAACYAVFHGLAIPENNWFTSSPVPLPNNDNLLRPNCDENIEDCQCRAHWSPMTLNFPDYWQELQSDLNTCMATCASQYSDCDMVLGGFGEGGMVAALLSFHFADTFSPYVFGVGSPNVLYDRGCSGIDESRYFRFVNVAESTAFGDGDYGICFDEIPFLGHGSLVDFGSTIGLGMEAGDGMMVATGGTGQVMVFEQGAIRTSLCRIAHDATSYASKMNLAFMRNPNGFTPKGFSDTQYCEVDQDCQRGSMCAAPGASDFPECTGDSEETSEPVETSSPTPNPTRNPTSLPTVLFTFEPTMSPTFTTLSPTPFPTSSPPTIDPTPIPSHQPTDVPTPDPTTATPTPRPTQTPLQTPLPTYSRRPTPLPTNAPLPTPLPTNTPRPTWKPTTSPPSPRPSPTPNPTPALVLSTPVPSTARPTLGSAQSLPPDASLPAISDSFYPTFSPSSSTPMPTSLRPTSIRSPSPTFSSNTEEPTALVETDTLSPTANEVIIDVEPGNTTEEQVLPPTQQPELSPGLDYSIENDFFRVTLVLKGVVKTLGGFTVFRWEDDTSAHLQESIMNFTEELGWDPPLMQLKVQANIVTQTLLYGFVEEERSAETYPPNVTEGRSAENNPPNVMSAIESEPKHDKVEPKHDKVEGSGKRKRRHARGRWRRDRRVQETQVDSLQIVFEVAVSYRTPDPTRNGELDLLKIILNAFQSEGGRAEYTQRLKDSDDPTFASLSDFILQVEASDGLNFAANQAVNDGNGKDDTMLWAIIVAASVAAVSMVLILFFYWRRSASQRLKSEDGHGSVKGSNLLEIFEPASNENRANPQ
jgi:hypothetical protein